MLFIPPAIPRFRTSEKPNVDAITSSSAVVSWSKATDIPPGLEAHYYYVAWLHIRGETKWKAAHTPHGVHNSRLESHITGLMFNTHHSVKVEPYRQQNKTHEAGNHTDETSFKTDCIGTVTAMFIIQFSIN